MAYPNRGGDAELDLLRASGELHALASVILAERNQQPEANFANVSSAGHTQDWRPTAEITIESAIVPFEAASRAGTMAGSIGLRASE